MASLMQNKAWKTKAIDKSELITDTWDVVKVYLGRGAVVILFACMIGDVIQVLPGGILQQWIISTILGVQIVTIDVAGFGLQSIAENARLNGDAQGYKKAMYTSYALISIMMITLFLLTTAQIWPDTKGVVSIANDALILVRVGMTVLYGHIVHSLGKSHNQSVPPHVADDLQRQIEAQRQEIERIRQEHTNERTRLEQQYENRETILKTSIMEEVTQRLLETIPVPIPSIPGNIPVIPGNATVFMGMDATPSGIQENQEDVSNGVEPFPTIPMNVRNDIIDARKTGLAKSKICAALGWGNGKYPLVKQVLDEWERQQVTIGNASS